MAIVDTSFLIALQDEDDHFHRRAKETPLIGDRFLVPWEIWIECCQTLMRMVPGRQAAAAVSSVLHGPFHVDKVLSAEEIAALVARSEAVQRVLKRLGHRPLSLFDLIVCAVAQRYRESILTFHEGMIAAVQHRLFPGARIH